MPATGGFTPGPERYGAGEGNSNAPLLQRVFESIAAQRGSAYDQTVSSVVGVENMAIARAITFDGYGTNERLANQFLPSKMTADGLLPRWEKIFNVPSLPGDTESVRRARVGAAFARLGQPNTHQPVVDALAAAMGAVFTGAFLYADPNSANAIWMGAGNNTPTIPWYSTIDRIDVVVDFRLPGYLQSNGTANAAWYELLGRGNQILDAMLPAWTTWNMIVQDSVGSFCFLLDDPMNLNFQVFCT
ncbi:MAG TPA: hypothetical protein VGM06_01815 [Polyangiaceae bacterium]|jgi:hypothetical protein